MKGRILIIDDDDGVRMTVNHFLAADGYEIASASDGRQAVDLFEKFHPDLIITDLIMPVQDGMETIARLRQDHPNMKIIAMSGGARIGNDNVLQKAKKLGADHVISKPFECEQLIELVARSLA